MFDYEVTFISNYDGDTMDFLIDQGLDTSRKITVRLFGVDTPEMRGGTPESKILADNAKQYVFNALSKATYVRIKTIKDSTEKYGRYLAKVIFTHRLLTKNDIGRGLREAQFDDLLNLEGFKNLADSLLTECIGTAPYIP